MSKAVSAFLIRLKWVFSGKLRQAGKGGSGKHGTRLRFPPLRCHVFPLEIYGCALNDRLLSRATAACDVMGCGQVVELSVSFLDVEPDEDEDADDGKSCSYDCLQLFDGNNVHAQPLSARLCGHVAPSSTFVTSSNAACVHFRSDYFTAGTGFRLDYHVVVSQQYLQTQRFSGTKTRLSHQYNNTF